VTDVGHPGAAQGAGRARALAAGLVMVMVLAGAGCASTDQASGDFHPAQAGVLTVATAEIPLPGMWNGTAAHPTGGFEYELAKALADQLGLARVKVVIVAFTRMVGGDLGGADLALSDVTATDQRRQVLEFTGPYLAATPAVLVRTGQSVPDLETAQGLSWAVGRSTTLHDFLTQTIRPTGRPVLSSSQAQTVAAVEDHRVDAGLLDLPVAAAIARDSADRLSVAGQFDSNDDLSAALPSGSANLDAASSAIRALIADGTISSLAKRWLGLTVSGTSAQQVPLIRTQG
jgi:polar amino acid transport system substrate-binding protein